ncbi:MAG TPA: nucleotide sugar dehydrogenase [Streptosporangiaceae bacterium]|nr:nucleotide sugar dehydrogenase [Streptosporangiaceae bacterium]
MEVLVEIAVLGLGYVGAVAAACLAEGGHGVAVVDINQAKTRELNAGRSPVMEPGLAELIERNVAAGRLSATVDLSNAVLNSQATIICVGTPSSPSGDVRLMDLDRVVDQLGDALRNSASWHLVMLTSTVPPGTTEKRVIPRLEEVSGKTCGRDFGVAFSPEFLREGSALDDYRNPARILVGASDSRALDCAAAIFRCYAHNITPTSIPVAEMAKLTDNSWHALKVTFTNEIGRICSSLGIDSQAVMNIFTSDTRLNISAAYMRPGFAFGGSCLPKDLRTLVYRARQLGVAVPVLEAVLPSNRSHIDAALRIIQNFGARRIALLGVAFKPGTDDLRESAMLELAELLLGKGYELAIHDEYVNPDRLVGANQEYVKTMHPHIVALLSDDLDIVLKDADLVIVAQANPAYADLCELVTDRPVLDLSGVARTAIPAANYQGLSW